MIDENMKFIPHNTARLRNKELKDKHHQLIASNNVANLIDAVNLVKNNKDAEVFSASMLNNIEEKLVQIENTLESKERVWYTVFSQTEPTDEEMKDKYFWVQNYD